jgi:hypothetical protein
MGSFSNYLENKILDHIFKVAAYAVPTNIYVALSTADPGEAGGTIAEPVGNAYARTVMNVWDAAAGGATQNTNQITFPQATGSWGTITHFALFDASVAGNMLAHGALSVAKAVTNGDTPRFNAGDIDVTLD